ncbi:MAG: DUF2628 domain-containing protein [Oscillospiraceae bacterium]|nr:DUF2628 domain-containing protein [Oscillospiraceae bacterium]
MANYLGVKCPVCSKRFAQADDVVVCPVCGAPHHRECYAQCGECAFTKDHLNGKEWRPPADEGIPGGHGAENRASSKTCQRCGSANPNEALFCQICGSSLTVGNSPPCHQRQGMGGFGGRPGTVQDGAPNNGAYTYNPPYQPSQDYSDPYAGLDQSEKVGGFSAKDVAMFVGPNYTYYLERFYQIEKYGRALQPNLAAAFLGFFYYFYRKMYRMGALTLLIFLLCTVPFFVLFWEFLPEGLYQYGLAGPPEVAPNTPRINFYSNMLTMAVFFNFSFNLIVSLYANRAYHRLVVTRIHETMQEHRHTNEYQTFLPRVGGVSRLGVVLLGLSLFIGFQVIGSFLLFSSNLL